MFEICYIPITIVVECRFKGGPRNSGGTYLGKIPLRTAVEKSKNVVAWRLFKELTPKVGIYYELKMNFANIVANDYYLSASLGGLTNGVITVEFSAAYASIVIIFVYLDSTCVTKITVSSGNVVINNKKNREKKQV